jgi:hypothetical protein
VVSAASLVGAWWARELGVRRGLTPVAAVEASGAIRVRVRRLDVVLAVLGHTVNVRAVAEGGRAGPLVVDAVLLSENWVESEVVVGDLVASLRRWIVPLSVSARCALVHARGSRGGTFVTQDWLVRTVWAHVTNWADRA